ncbi:MAG: hypothetical protein OXC96_11160 [Cyanobacteria bacterium MAG CAR1_bin_15]|nr:hypothetical protein [Cyanobacteria bacterium MAG CAR1_bin_15]
MDYTIVDFFLLLVLFLIIWIPYALIVVLVSLIFKIKRSHEEWVNVLLAGPLVTFAIGLIMDILSGGYLGEKKRRKKEKRLEELEERLKELE